MSKHKDLAKSIDEFCSDSLNPRSGLGFPNLDMATRAATLGAGFVMADLVICREELESGLVIKPFPEMICDGPHGGIS